MKKILKKKGIILNSKPYKDNYRILNILCEDGLCSVLLKGSEKMSSGNKKYTITPVEVEFMMTESNTLGTFTEGYVLNNYTNIKNDNEKSLVFLVIAEKILAFSQHVDNTIQIYNFLRSILELLDKYGYCKVVLSIFEIKLLYLIGIAPILNKCLGCGIETNQLSFSISRGGCFCSKCSSLDEYDLSINETEIFKYLYLIKFDKIDEKFLSIINDSDIDLSKIIDKYYAKYIDFHSKTKKIIEKVS